MVPAQHLAERLNGPMVIPEVGAGCVSNPRRGLCGDGEQSPTLPREYTRLVVDLPRGSQPCCGGLHGFHSGERCEACKMVSDPDLERSGKTSVVAPAQYRGDTTSATCRDR
jgi:hypothetical protein